MLVRESTLMAQGFDPDTLQLKGDAFPVAEETVRNPTQGRAIFSVSETGVLVFRSGAINSNQLIWFDRSGKQLSVLTPPGFYNAPSLSPDETKVAVSCLDRQTGTPSDIRVIAVEQSFPGNGYYTVTHDGKRFLVTSLAEATERQQINVILNWTADLKK